MNDIEHVVDEKTYREIMRARYVPENTLGKFLRERTQVFLTENEPNLTVTMSRGRKYNKTPKGWALQKTEIVV